MGVAPPPPRRKRDGVKKKAKPVKRTNVTSIDALVVHKTKLDPADEAKLFESNKSALNRSHERFTRAILSVISQYHQAYIDWYPYDPKSYERQGYSEFHLEHYAKAVERLSQAVYLGANSAKMWRTLGRACYLLWKQTHDWGLLWDAKSCFENGLRFVQVAMNPFALFEFSHVLECLGEFDAALGVVRTLLYSFPQFAHADHVVLRATILMFHSVVFQKKQPKTTDPQARQDMLEQCCDYCKFIIDKDVTKTDMYVTLLYVTARVHEAAGLPRTVKYAAKSYEELYRYFDRRDDVVLAVDAAQEGIKRIDVTTDRSWNRTTFCWEPETSMWYTLGSLFFKANDMIPAVAAMETSLYFGRYRNDVRDMLLQWYAAPFAAQDMAARRIQVRSDKARRTEQLRVHDAACMIQRRFRTIRSNALLHTRHILRQKKERLAVNLQRLYRRKKSLVVQFLQRQQDLDFYARRIQALFRGRKDRLCLRGLRRVRMPPMPSILHRMIHHLRVLAIGRNDIEADSPGCMPCRDLSTCLQTAHFQLRHLIVEDNDLTDVGAMHIAQAVGDYFFGRCVSSCMDCFGIVTTYRYGHLERLVLARVGMTDAACEAFGQALSINMVLHTLDLHGNRIHDAGAAALAAGFRNSRTLHTLDLSDNGVGTVGAKTLFRAMETSTVTTLMLLNNNVKNDIMGALAAFLKTKDCGCVVELRGNLIHVDNMHEIQSWFTPEYPDDKSKSPVPIITATTTTATSFEDAKRKLFRPRNPEKVAKPSSKDALKELRRERRAIPLSGHTKSASHLLNKPYRKFQRALYTEMRQRLKLDEADHSIPETIGMYAYYLKTLPRLNFPVYCRQHIDTKSEQVLLNPNDMDAFGQIGVFKVSPDGHFLAYTMDQSGDELYDAYVKDLRTSRTTKLRQHVRSIEWDTVGSLYYTVPDAMHRPSRVFRHRPTGAVADDVLVFEEHDPSVYVDVVLTKDNQYVLINANSKRSSEVHTLDATDAAAVPLLLRPRDPNVLYFADHATDAFYIVTNDNHVRMNIGLFIQNFDF
ncbi:hypothetical protein DYB34_005636 [Aphanomyces astaci]|uniref:Peptidase S9A N-terminal domain-containing protein n=1 Tax=Aphanomyces astaci TaxID=112090 RepID=A0A418BQX3_APHAT|nr:hypothetical protein DYB34_005636 [Aphanomyces astaci]